MKKILLSILLTIIISPNLVFADATSECNNAASYTMGANSTSSAAIRALNECKNTLNQYSSSELSSAFSQCKNEKVPQLEAWGSLNSSAAFEVIYKCAYLKVSATQNSSTTIYVNTYSASNDNDWNKLFLEVTTALSDHVGGLTDIYKTYVDSIVLLSKNTANDYIQNSNEQPLSQTEYKVALKSLDNLKTDLQNNRNEVTSSINDDIKTLQLKKIDYIDNVNYNSFINEVYSTTYKYFSDSNNWISDKSQEGIHNIGVNIDRFKIYVKMKQTTTSTTTPTVAIAPSTSQAIINSDSEVFSDINTSHKYSNSIMYLKKSGIIDGYPDGTFKPTNTINRAELLKILIGNKYDTTGHSNCFKDVNNEWFAPYVCYAKKQNWIQGYSDGAFKPAQAVNRAEAIKMAIEVFGIDLPSSISVNPYPDTDNSQWFAKYVLVAKEKGLFDSSMTSYQPSNGMQRGDVSDIIYRLLAIKKLQSDTYDISLDNQM